MKVKEVDRTANIAWSPQAQVPIYLAAGTAAQQLDASFCTDSSLEIYGLNLSESGHDMPVVASLPVEQRFHKLVWGGAGMAEDTMPSGLLVGGADRGTICMYDAAKLVKGGEDAMVFSTEKHTGPVTALDFNPFQANLLASGASESEINIWDVNKLSSPMTPGAKSQPLEEVRSVAWNRQVQHILASTFASRCVVWDLRKNDPIIKVSDSTSRSRWKVVAWHPEVATQMCLASEDDHTPVIQVWDLRQASSPMKTLEGHTAGVLSVAWCQADSDLLLSCGKDNRILVWNPNRGGGEIVAELPTSNQWSFEVSWCPRNPAVIASASFDGHVSVHSLMGGQQQAQPSSRVEESFGASLAPQASQPGPQVTMQLKAPPKWLMAPCGASFGFGGRLVTVEQTAGAKPAVFLSTVVTEPDLVAASAKLEVSLGQGNFPDFCQAKLAELGPDTSAARLWQFLSASFLGDAAAPEFLNLLGVSPQAITEGLRAGLEPVVEKQEAVEEPKVEAGGWGGEGGGDEFDQIAAQVAEVQLAAPPAARPTALDSPFPLARDATPQGKVTSALLAGDLELAVDLCVQQARFAEALVLAIRGGHDLLQRTQARYFQECGSGGPDLALVEAVTLGSWDRLVEHCHLDSWREALAAVLTYTGPGERERLSGQLAARLSSGGREGEALLVFTVAGDMDRVVETWLGVEAGDLAQAQELQHLVEVVVMVRAAVLARGLPATVSQGGRVQEALARYAGLLAAQGSLRTALAYLNQVESGGEGELGELKARLEKSLAPAKAVQQQQPAVQQGRSARQPSQTPSFSSRKSSLDPYSSHGQPSYFQPPQQEQPQPSFLQPQQPPSQQYQPPNPYQPPSDPVPTFQPPPSLPAAPTSQPSNPLLGGRRTVDPSISGPQYQPYQPPNQQFQPPTQQFQPPTQQFQPPNQPYQPPVHQFQPEPLQQQYEAPAPGIFNPGEALQPSTLPPQAMDRQPDQPGPGFTPAVSSGYGWNDPPPATVAKNAFSRQTNTVNSVPAEGASQQFFTPAPISAPAPAPSWGGFQPQAPVQQQQQQAGFSGFQPSEPPMQQQQQQQQHQQQPPANQPPVSEPQPPAPIPAEHQVIQDVLESLRSKCQQAASHPQVRRKLDDVSTKLDILYNKLRAGGLSAATLQGLHSILQHVWQYDYPACMQVIAGLIAGGSFAEMSDFMPGVKMLLQVAQQQGVYVEYQQ